jgi:hypothetical protein
VPQKLRVGKMSSESGGGMRKSASAGFLQSLSSVSLNSIQGGGTAGDLASSSLRPVPSRGGERR